MRPFRNFVSLFTAPVDIASLVAFRFLFGVLMAGAMVRFMAKGWVYTLYVQPRFYFSYPGFHWVHPWPAPFMYLHFGLLVLFALAIAFGFFYRASAFLFFAGFTYVELIDQTNFLNHYYLISLLSALFIFIPANRTWSWDARRNPKLPGDHLPAWCLNLLRFQFAVVYIFAGLAKLNSDWLIDAQPLRIWFAARSDLPIVGTMLNATWVAYTASWLGAIFDCGIVFALLATRTRKLAFITLVVFHLATWLLFNIGVFPWLMILGATLFFPPCWPRRLLHKFACVISWKPKFSQFLQPISLPRTCADEPCMFRARNRIAVPICICLYALFQLAIPIRSYFDTQPPAWTGSRFNCAWRVMIAEKTGYAEFYALDSVTGRQWRLDLKNYLTPRQEVLMAQDPYLIRALARYLSQELNRASTCPIQIRVSAFASLNGRPSQKLVKSDIDLAATCDWVIPLDAHKTRTTALLRSELF
jgi:vitamin K-dependent gamma-carboxylase